MAWIRGPLFELCMGRSLDEYPPIWVDLRKRVSIFVGKFGNSRENAHFD